VAFQTTRWSLIARAKHSDDGARQALDELCRVYWPPVYAMYRGEGVAAEQARDLTQGLFASLLERQDLGKANPERGRFRSFLRTCARNWLLNERDRDQARKRGGDAKQFSLVIDEEEQRFLCEPATCLDAAAIF
jgi:DNA-directed RNA polymerase specialized sigma24 family protein